jgi:hypothetical protein
MRSQNISSRVALDTRQPATHPVGRSKATADTKAGRTPGDRTRGARRAVQRADRRLTVEEGLLPGAASGDNQPQLTVFFEGTLAPGQDTEPGAITEPGGSPCLALRLRLAVGFLPGS